MKKKMDLLLVNAGGFRKKVYQDLSKNLSAIEPPFWAVLTAGFIREKGFEVGVLDANAENLDIKESVRAIENYDPRLVNIVVYGQHPSASTALMPIVGKLCEEIKNENFSRKVILTGLHPSALSKRTLEEEACDFVAKGEGFYTLLGLLEKENFSKIPGLWYRENREIVGNERGENIANLDTELKEIAWDLLPMDKYLAHNWHCLNDLNSRQSYASISTTLGCPFTCEFCCINAPFGGPSYREWSADWSLKQIDILVKKYNVKNLKIIDELFVLKPQHFMKIAEGLIKRDYGLNIWAYARIDTSKEKYLTTLKKAGFNWLGLGIESGSQNIREDSEKGRFKQTDIKEVAKRIHDHGIEIGANYIFGLSGDTKESMKKTLNLALNLNCSWNNFYCAMAYPGSKLHDYAVENKIPLPEDNQNIGWIGYSQHSYKTMPLSNKSLSAAEILRFRDNAFNTYFSNPKYLNMIKEKFGIEAREHIKEMTKTKLKRRLLGD